MAVKGKKDIKNISVYSFFPCVLSKQPDPTFLNAFVITGCLVFLTLMVISGSLYPH